MSSHTACEQIMLAHLSYKQLLLQEIVHFTRHLRKCAFFSPLLYLRLCRRTAACLQVVASRPLPMHGIGIDVSGMVEEQWPQTRSRGSCSPGWQLGRSRFQRWVTADFQLVSLALLLVSLRSRFVPLAILKIVSGCKTSQRHPLGSSGSPKISSESSLGQPRDNLCLFLPHALQKPAFGIVRQASWLAEK